MLQSRIPVFTKKTQLSTNNEEIKARENKLDSRPAVTLERKEKMTMFKPRLPAPVKKTQHSSSIETNKAKEKKIFPKFAVTNSQASNVKKFQTQLVNRNQLKYQKPGSSQIAGERERCSVAIPKQPKIVRKKGNNEQGKRADFEEDCCKEKENFSESKENDDNFNEHFRQLILSGKELTPSMLNRGSDVKFSLNRTSSLIHRPFIVPADPCKEALKAIENMRLSNAGTLQVKRRVLTTPMKESFTYSNNPYEVAMKSIEILKRKKKLLRSQKKVTFNLQADIVPLHSAEQQRKELELQEELEVKLGRISELDESSHKSSRESSLKMSTLTEELANTKDATNSVPTNSKCGVKNKDFTPCLVSCKPQLLENSGSPELGEKPKKIITHDVLESNGLEVSSPVRLKLNFNDVEVKSKEEKSLSHVQSSVISDTFNGILLRDIPTARNILDNLGDEECSVILLRQKLPLVCGSTMRNPMLIILSETDETKDTLENEASISKVIKVPVIKVKEDDLKHLIPSGSL